LDQPPRGPYALLSPGSLAVPQLQCRDRHVGGVGGEAGQPQSVGVGDPQLGAGAAGVALYLDTRAAYQALVVCAALACTGSAPVLNRLPVILQPLAPGGKPSPWTALRDPRYLRFTGLNAVLSLNGGLMEIALPLWLVTTTRAPTWLFSALVVMNTALVVLFRIGVSPRVSDTDPGAWARVSRLGGMFLGCACLRRPVSRAPGVHHPMLGIARLRNLTLAG
jgi:hypothetical protein